MVKYQLNLQQQNILDYLLENIKVDAGIEKVLDLASGNGVIAHELRTQCPHGELHLMDDSHLAIESSKLNLSSSNTFFHYAHHLDHFQDDYFDLVVSNPPFHFEHENTIEIALNLFKGVRRILKSKGEFVLVANKHLNYKTHLRKLFSYVITQHMNSKFEII